MGHRKSLALIAAFVLSSIETSLFSEVTLGEGKLNVSLFSQQNFAVIDSTLNPGNIFEVEEGYYGNEKFCAGYALQGGCFSVRVNDFGSILADDNPDGRNCIGEIYGSLRIGGTFLDIGKKRINQSLSYFKSPINFVLDGYDQYELRFSEGKIMANLDAFTDYGFIGLSYIPRIKFSDDVERYASSSQKQQELARYDVTILDCAMGVAISKDDQWRLGAHVSRVFGSYTEAHFEGVLNEAKERYDFSVKDGIASYEKVKKWNQFEELIGITANLPFLTGIVEYYYNQAGYSKNEWKKTVDEYRAIVNADDENIMYFYNLGTSYRSLTVNRSFNGRHYLMLRLSNPTTDDYQVAVNTIINLQDSSGMVMPSISYSGWDNITVEALFSKSFGGRFSEFSLYGNSWNCGLSVELWL
jgi:hypothetical protein